MTKNLFITSTRQNDGKTMITVGLTRLLARRLGNIGFMKPLGRRDFAAGGLEVDGDVALIAQVCNIHDNLQDMSPFTLPGGIPVQQMDPKAVQFNRAVVMEAYKNISARHDFIIIEGTGHGAVGSAFGLSNGYLASQMNCKVLLVASGGVAQPVDEILLNKAFFDQYDVEIVGVIVNKVFPKELEALHEHASRLLKKEGIPILGAIPYNKAFMMPTVMQAFNHLGGKLLCGEPEALGRQLKSIGIGAMTPQHAAEHATDGMLLITPGDRGDLLLAMISSSMSGSISPILGIVITGGIEPAPNVMHLMKIARIPAMLVKADSFSAASKVDKMYVKLASHEKDKLAWIDKKVEENVLVNQLIRRLED